SGLNLLDALAENGAELPAVVMSAFADVPMAVTALQKGAIHFIEKPFREQVLLDAVHSAIAVDAQRRKQRTQREEILARVERLTPRERQVMDLVVAGFPNKEIAQKMGISVKSIEANRARIMRKMQAGSFAALIRMAMALENAPPAAKAPVRLKPPPERTPR